MDKLVQHIGVPAKRDTQSDLRAEVDEVAQRFILMVRAIDLMIEMAKSRELWPEVYDRAGASDAPDNHRRVRACDAPITKCDGLCKFRGVWRRGIRVAAAQGSIAQLSAAK